MSSVLINLDNLPLHTNKAIAIQKEKRKKVSKRSEEAIASGNIQDVIDSLSERQRRFCEEYLVDLNATQAILRSGYNTKFPNRIAFQLMENPAVRIAIDGLRSERTKGADVTKDFVLQQIMRTIRKAEEDNNHNAVLRGTELLARHLGMFVERTEISGPDGAAIEYKKSEEDAADFTNTIANLSKRA